jgi:hypothetical protein
VTSQGAAYARFRALDSHNVTVAYATAAELDFVIVLVVDDLRRFRRAVLRACPSARA